MPPQTENNILKLLRQWLSGKASPSAKDQLQRAADDDPFLAEALEGYEQFPNAQHGQNLDRMRKQLRTRTGGSAAVKPLYQTGLARAAMLAGVVIGLGVIWQLNQPKAEMAMQLEPTKDQTETAATSSEIGEDSDAIITFSDVTDNSTQKEKREENSIPTQKPTTPPSPPKTASPIAQKRKTETTPSSGKVSSHATDHSASHQSNKDQVIVEKTKVENKPTDIATTSNETANQVIETNPIEAADQIVEEVAPPVVTADVIVAETKSSPAPSTASTDRKKVKRNTDSAWSSAPAAPTQAPFIEGRITDDNGEPLIGANIIVPGTTMGVVTDFDGYFKIEAAPDIDQLEVSYIGFQTTLVNVDDKAYVDIQIKETLASLDEVVVSGYGSRRFNPQGMLKPKGGFKKFNKYIRKNLTYPDTAKEVNISGEVELAFLIDENGKPKDIAVIRTLGFGCDEEAIRLLKEGPTWKFSEDMRGTLTTYVFKFGQ